MKNIGKKRWGLAFLAGLTLWLGVNGLAMITSTTEEVQAQTLPEKVLLENFPIYAQWHSLSCEYSATRMITAYWKQEISEADFINTIGFNPNPHIGFRGNIDGWFGGTWDYGIYAEPISKMLEGRNFHTKLLVGGAEALKRELALGRPVQVWVIAGMGWGSAFTTTSEGLPFKLAGGEHSIVIYGYDNQGVYVADPAYGGRAYYGWDTFLRSWSLFDYMAMSVWTGEDSDQGEVVGVSNLFYRHWLNAGAMSLFGYPLDEAKVEDGKIVQYFERSRFEAELDRVANRPVVMGLLGRELTAGREAEPAFQGVSSGDFASRFYVDNTKHTLDGDFKAYWEKNGGVAAFGYPISEEFSEGGKMVQYFERARFEYNGELASDYRVVLGRLGAERMNKK